jgi:hypothetical protein
VKRRWAAPVQGCSNSLWLVEDLLLEVGLSIHVEEGVGSVSIQREELQIAAEVCDHLPSENGPGLDSMP